MSKHWLVSFGLVMGLMVSSGVQGQEVTAHSETTHSEQNAAIELDEAALAEIERLRAEVERLLSTVPPSLHDRVRELLLTSSEPSALESATPVSDGTAADEAEPVVAAAGVDSAADPAPPVSTESKSRDVAEAVAEAGDGPVIESSKIEPAKSEPSEIEPSKRQGPSLHAQRVSRRPTCNSLDPLDENGDGKINAQDRYWRYLYVWIDQNRDGQRQDKEVESAYAAGVREIANSLGIFYRKKGSVGEIRRDKTLLLDLAGNGFGAGRRPDDGVLMVDTDGLGRGDGPQVLAANGAPVEGIAPFVAGWKMRLGDGQVLAINCPPGGSE